MGGSRIAFCTLQRGLSISLFFELLKTSLGEEKCIRATKVKEIRENREISSVQRK